jgi:hypothetical protein
VTVTDAGGNHVRVTGIYTYQPMLGGSLPTFGLGPSINTTFSLQSSAVMRAL